MSNSYDPFKRFIPGCCQFLMGLIFCFNFSAALAQKVKPEPVKPPVYAGENGRLSYTPDLLGNRIPDFSYCGYKAGEVPIPAAAIKVFVPVQQGDALTAIQSAIDYVSALAPGKDGLRGAVLLQKGRYEVSGSLRIAASGVVLRGSGTGAGGTVLVGTGQNRETLVRITGRYNKKTAAEEQIKDKYVPVNAMQLSIAEGAGFRAGDKVTIRRPSTKEWIDRIGTDHFGGGITSLGWKEGQRDIFWDRTIVSVKSGTITLDAPLTTALEQEFGGGFIAAYSWDGRISNTGVENMEMESVFDAANPKDEDHRWMAITLENVRDAWVRQVNFKHFAGSAVSVLATASRITVEDCKSVAPVSEIGGQRRNTFFCAGQQTLFQRLYAAYGYHDFAVGFAAAGPNAFVECKAYMPYSFSGTTDSWASGVLFDIVNIDGQAALSFMNRGQDGMGAGWTAANSVFWQCSASRVDCYQPPGAQNWSFGTWAQFSGDGYWGMSNEQIKPRSLYYAQLKDRIGDQVSSRTFLMPVPGEASSSPPVEVAQALTKAALQPAFTLEEFIDQAAERQKIPVDGAAARSVLQIGIKKIKQKTAAAQLSVKNGWLVRGNTLMNGGRQDVQWWTGSARPYGLKGAKSHITRFVPGATGMGLTDDLEVATDSMVLQQVRAIDHNYGLWYERRRDDHERIRRIDGDVWPPFYELPFARSGQGTAYDGLSKYDLTKYNKWYWGRLKQFADLADEKGLVLLHQNYFQHNIIEAGAHYADFPWRTANNINHTGFPEPVPYAGDKRIFMAEQFYDIHDPARAQLHRAYIRQCLDNFKDNSGVIQFIGAEFTGPLHFVQFWIDTIREWEKETGRKALVALSTTKDVQDAILADKERAAVVDMIDIRYWHYQADGKAYAPAGGQSLAPRQQARLFKPKKTSFDEVYRAVHEYKLKYPQKAVMYSGDNFDSYGWASLMAGGSLANVPAFADPQLQHSIEEMVPFEIPGKPAQQWALAIPGKAYLIYTAGTALNLSLPEGRFLLRNIDIKTGLPGKTNKKINGGKLITDKPEGAAQLFLITKI